MRNNELAALLKKVIDNQRSCYKEKGVSPRLVTNERRIKFFAQRWLQEWTTKPKPLYGRASRLMHSLIDYRPEEAWQRILVLIDEADDYSLGLIGAGPLEDLLSTDAEQFIERVEAQATTNPRFRVSLLNVWGYSVIEESIYLRIRRAAEQSN